MLDLIVDRTLSDVTNHTDKGYYNASDLNRVTNALKYLVSIIREYGYDIEYIDARPGEWLVEDIPTEQQTSTYLQNVNNVRDALSVLSSTPSTPGSMNNFTYEMANDIEKILIDVELLLDSLASVYKRSGEKLSIAGLNYYFPELYYYLMDSEGIRLLDSEGVALKAK